MTPSVMPPARDAAATVPRRHAPAVIALAALLPVVSMSLASCRPHAVAEASAPPDAIQVHAASIPWRPGPASLPAGARVAVLEGDPSAPRLFTMRLDLPAGARIAPHTHPRAERVTVLEGEVGVGFGERVDPTATTRFRAGDYYVNPPNVPHYVEFTARSVVQITGEGPWELRTID